MRVTQLMVTRNFNQNLQRNNTAIDSLRQQISSGMKYEKVSDNPMAAMKGLSHRSSIMQLNQYQNNAQDGIDWLTAADDALDNATTVLQRIKELTVKASNDTTDEIDRKSIATEIRSLKDQLGSIANTDFMGKYLFSGMDQSKAPYSNGGLQNVVQSGMNWDVGQGMSVSVNVNANSIFGFSVDGKNLFETLDTLVQTLEDGQNPNNLLGAIDKQMDNVLTQRTIVGANQNLLELAANKLDQANFLQQKMWSKVEDTDYAQAYIELTAHETALKASLSAGARLMQPTLVDFLR
ncbi:flagellar hook-associated protein FlgL [Neobacillus sp. NPDC058068]|uniref:flagellar hook-associated protein FlgL n=1 Tax=Neobacillus sp. NPDC058068 TaxID=3346325 RepID=UPI0036D953A4